ncbi:hypothetical protein [Streptomyces sp. NPDC020965]|uniref:hypothetical protein n=1 Tax=Streptomyces sp. NPDC020965 TaxID=3365105 RepID=UPI00378BA727
MQPAPLTRTEPRACRQFAAVRAAASRTTLGAVLSGCRSIQPDGIGSRWTQLDRSSAAPAAQKAAHQR